jgi:hypothetical protein
MAYRTPHAPREYISSSCLAVCHSFVIRCQRRSAQHKGELLRRTREIDLCAGISSFFGPVAKLAAQGTNDIDLIIGGPTIAAEVKYFRPPAKNWTNIRDDWDWLVDVNAANEVRRRIWIAFWPSTEMFKFTNCLSVAKGHVHQYSLLDFAPFVPYAEPARPGKATNQFLKFKTPSRKSVLYLPGGRKVQVDIVGDTVHPLWCAVYSRVSPQAANAAITAGATRIDINDTAIVV